MTKSDHDFSQAVAGWMFVVGVLLWLGWVLLPVEIGTFFVPEDFAAVGDQFHLWLWLFRVHIFGRVISVMALAALAAVLAESPARALFWPGIAVVASGLMIGALGQAFYYHHGAWGALQTAGMGQGELLAHVESLRVDTEYVTCLVRFSRVSLGLACS